MNTGCYWMKGITSLFLFFLAVLWFELMVLHFLGRQSTIWAILPALLALVILKIKSHFLPWLTWTTILRVYTSCCSWDDRCMATIPSYCLRWSLVNIWLERPGTMILLISASDITRMTGMRHPTLDFLKYLQNVDDCFLAFQTLKSLKTIELAPFFLPQDLYLCW
jgi:hypothetical protein